MNEKIVELFNLTGCRVSVLEFLGKYSVYIGKTMIAEFVDEKVCSLYLDSLIRYEHAKRVKDEIKNDKR